MSTQLAEQQDKARLSYVRKSVQDAIKQMPDLINQSEATRLTLNIWSAALDSISAGKGRQFTWTQDGIRNFITQAIKYVALGLDAANRELWVYPYGDVMSLSPSSHGYLKLVKEYAVGEPVKDMLVFVIRQGEKFKVRYGAETDEWEYENDLFSDAAPIGYVTVLVYQDGTSRVMEHTLADIEARKAKAGSGKGTSPAWEQWPIEMAKAKAIKRHARTVNIKLKPELEKVGVQRMEDLPDFEQIKDVTPDVIELPEVAESKSEKVTAEVEVMPDEEVPLPFGYGDSGQGQIDEGWMR